MSGNPGALVWRPGGLPEFRQGQHSPQWLQMQATAIPSAAFSLHTGARRVTPGGRTGRGNLLRGPAPWVSAATCSIRTCGGGRPIGPTGQHRPAPEWRVRISAPDCSPRCRRLPSQM